MGYPSWHDFSTQAHRELQYRGLCKDPESYMKHLRNHRYPELFRQLERDLSEDRIALTDLMKPLLKPKKHTGRIYDLIASWPFACYLTTNYDDEIHSHLAALNVHYTVKRNRRNDFHVWRDGVSGVIQKLHSDLAHPREAIITSADYHRLEFDAAWKYYRSALTHVLTTFDVFIIGHSLRDPDIDLILKLAKEIRAPQHPVYMVTADSTLAEEKDLLEQYNLVLVKYSNQDGTHSELLRLLQTADRFIVSRQRLTTDLSSTLPKEQTKAAVTIYLYRRLQGVQATDYLSPLILVGLASRPEVQFTRTEIRSLPVLNNLLGNRLDYDMPVSETLTALVRKGLVDHTPTAFRINEKGLNEVKQYHSVRELQMDQAYGQFCLHLKGSYPAVTPSQLSDCRSLAEDVIVASFASRGATIANTLFSSQAAQADALSDVFGHVSDRSAEIENMDLRLAFIDAIHEFLVQPNSQQRDYLASVSQGYFLYHLLGLDPAWQEIRQRLARNTLWLCDSSVIIPWVAKGCYNHDQAAELFRLLRNERGMFCTTAGLLQEVWEHFKWAQYFIDEHGSQSLEFLRAALVNGSYRQNLFLDGYVRLNADGVVGTYEDYSRLICPKGEISKSSFEDCLRGSGLRIYDLDYGEVGSGDLDHVAAEVQAERVRRGTFRSPHQVRSEAEASIFLRRLEAGNFPTRDLDGLEHFYFVSQSAILERTHAVKTWAPEALYRYLSSFPDRETNADLLQQCMLSEYYYAGIKFVDRPRYERFFGSIINESKTSYRRELDGFIKDRDDAYCKGLTSSFESTPDLEKPMFVAQMGWRRAAESQEREEQAQLRVAALEDRVRRLVADSDVARRAVARERRRQDLARARNRRNPKHIRKRIRQAKKRKKKKGK